MVALDLSSVEAQFVDLTRQLSEMQDQVDFVESLQSRILELEDIGWAKVFGGTGGTQSGPSLDDLKKVVPQLRDMAATTPLHIRGAQLRHAYVFGRGIGFARLNPRTKKAMSDPYNQASVFNVQAYEINNIELFTTGNFFLLRDEADRMMVVPLEEIVGESTSPDNSADIRFFLREWSYNDNSGKVVTQRRWYPLARYKSTLVGRGRRGAVFPTSIKVDGKAVPVSQTSVLYHQTTKRQAGWVYGVPDSLGGMLWTRAYSEYLRDSATLVKALRMLAWSITSTTKSSKSSAAVSVASGGVGGTAVMGSGNTLSGVGVPSSQVDFDKGQAMAALVATSFGVPVTALLSNPGASGGTYGAVASLDAPTIKGMAAVQDSWKSFYQEVLSDLGSPDAEVTFPSIESDPAYREIQSITTAKEFGLLHQDEAREGVLNVLDVKKLHDELPPDNPTATTAKQGVTGSVPGGVTQNTTPNSQGF